MQRYSISSYASNHWILTILTDEIICKIQLGPVDMCNQVMFKTFQINVAIEYDFETSSWEFIVSRTITRLTVWLEWCSVVIKWSRRIIECKQCRIGESTFMTINFSRISTQRIYSREFLTKNAIFYTFFDTVFHREQVKCYWNITQIKTKRLLTFK